MEIIFTEGIFKGLTMGDFQKTCAGMLILCVLWLCFIFKKNSKKPPDTYGFFQGLILPLLPLITFAIVFIIYDAPVKVVNISTGSTVQAKNMAEGKKILNFVKKQEDSEFLEDAARELYK